MKALLIIILLSAAAVAKEQSVVHKIDKAQNAILLYNGVDLLGTVQSKAICKWVKAYQGEEIKGENANFLNSCQPVGDVFVGKKVTQKVSNELMASLTKNCEQLRKNKTSIYGVAYLYSISQYLHRADVSAVGNEYIVSFNSSIRLLVKKYRGQKLWVPIMLKGELKFVRKEISTLIDELS